MIRTAQANVLAALTQLDGPRYAGGLPAFGRDARIRLLNTYFQIDGHGLCTQRVQYILNVFDRMRQTIYRCPGLKELPGDIRAFVVVHELAHLAVHPEFIDDHACNHQSKGMTMQRLTPQLRRLNAESCTNFAFETVRRQAAPVF